MPVLALTNLQITYTDVSPVTLNRTASSHKVQNHRPELTKHVYYKMCKNRNEMKRQTNTQTLINLSHSHVMSLPTVPGGRPEVLLSVPEVSTQGSVRLMTTHISLNFHPNPSTVQSQHVYTLLQLAPVQIRLGSLAGGWWGSSVHIQIPTLPDRRQHARSSGGGSGRRVVELGLPDEAVVSG